MARIQGACWRLWCLWSDQSMILCGRNLRAFRHVLTRQIYSHVHSYFHAQFALKFQFCLIPTSYDCCLRCSDSDFPWVWGRYAPSKQIDNVQICSFVSPEGYQYYFVSKIADIKYCLPGMHFAIPILSLHDFLTAPGDTAATAMAKPLAFMNVVVVVAVIFGDVVVTVVCVTTPDAPGPMCDMVAISRVENWILPHVVLVTK